jgi:tellurite resistance protein TehA-like permease
LPDARQAHGELGITADLACDLDPAAMLLGDDIVAYRQAETGTPLLCAGLLIALLTAPFSIVSELRDCPAGPRHLTIVAATCVLGNEIDLMGGYPGATAAVWAIAAILWLGLVYGFFARMTTRPIKADLATGIDGTWLLLVVGTEALAILTSRAAAVLVPANVAVFASFCLFLLGGAFYGMLLLLIVYRWLFLPLDPGQLNPAYWINMGAAAIATLAGARLCEVTGALSGAPPLRSFVFAATILFWSVATWWIPLLAALMLWRHGSGRVPFAYRLDNWSMVFPLGMYTTATWRLSHLGGLDFLQALPNVFVWIALAAWGLTFIGMLRALSSARPKAR